jgi:hypothetical protein
MVDIISQHFQKYYRFITCLALFSIFILGIYSDMYSKIDKSNRTDYITYLHNKSVNHLNDYLSIDNCYIDIKSSLHFKELNELHIKNGVKMMLNFNVDSQLGDLKLYTLKLISMDLIRNIKTFSYGYVLSNRKTNKCFGFIY